MVRALPDDGSRYEVIIGESFDPGTERDTSTRCR